MTHQLSIMSLNLWGIPRISQDREPRLRAFADLLPSLQVDMIGLQEVWAEADQKFLIRQAHQAGLTFAHYYRSGVMGSGLLTLSRYPIQEVAFYAYRMRSRPELIMQGDFWAGKGIGLARIQTPSGIVDFYNTHAVAQYAPDYQDDLSATRAANMWDAIGFINAQSQLHPAVVVGDFNISPHQPTYPALLTLANLTDCYDCLHPDDPSITFSLDNPYNRNYREPERIDYVFLRDGQTCSLIPQQAEITLKHQTDYPYKPYSDHYAVQVRIEVAEATPSTPSNQIPKVRAALEVLLKEVQKGLDQAIMRSQTHRWQAFLALIVSIALNPRRHRDEDMTRHLLRSWGAVLALNMALYSGLLHGLFVAEEIQQLRATISEIRIKLRSSC